MTSDLPARIVEVLRTVLPAGQAALHEPTFGGNELAYLKDCIDSTFVSSVGKYVDHFEQMLAETTGSRRAVAVVNGTAALELALRTAGLEQGDEVLTPTLTFAATAAAVVHAGGVPHFVDADEERLAFDFDSVRDQLRALAEFRNGRCWNRKSGRRIHSAIVVHVFGHPADMESAQKLCRDYRLELIEDAAESLGSYSQGIHTGRFGRIGVLSFNGNKIVTTGGGGALITDDSLLADRAKHLSTTAKVAHPWLYRHDAVGFNFRMPNLNAALGCAQLESLSGLLKRKRKLYHRYRDAFRSIDEVQLLDEQRGCSANFWLQAVRLRKPNREMRDQILQALNEAGYTSRPVWDLLHDQVPYQQYPRMPIETAARIEAALICLPSGAGLAPGD